VSPIFDAIVDVLISDSQLALSGLWMGFSTLHLGVWFLLTLRDSAFRGTLMATGGDATLAEGTISGASATQQRTY
jgi:hypothetical protein